MHKYKHVCNKVKLSSSIIYWLMIDTIQQQTCTDKYFDLITEIWCLIIKELNTFSFVENGAW